MSLNCWKVYYSKWIVRNSHDIHHDMQANEAKVKTQATEKEFQQFQQDLTETANNSLSK